MSEKFMQSLPAWLLLFHLFPISSPEDILQDLSDVTLLVVEGGAGLGALLKPEADSRKKKFMVIEKFQHTRRGCIVA